MKQWNNQFFLYSSTKQPLIKFLSGILQFVCSNISLFYLPFQIHRALKSHTLSMRLTQTNSILHSHAETIISHAFKIPCCFSENPS